MTVACICICDDSGGQEVSDGHQAGGPVLEAPDEVLPLTALQQPAKLCGEQEPPEWLSAGHPAHSMLSSPMNSKPSDQCRDRRPPRPDSDQEALLMGMKTASRRTA